MSASNETILVKVYLVRHGETQENRDGIIQGQADTKLNAVGVEQARMLGEALKEVEFDCAFSSDLSRAVDTAEAVLKHHSGVELVKYEELRERAMGDLEGKMAGNGMPGAVGIETSSAFTKRVIKWWNQRIAGCSGNMLVTTHGGVIVTLVQQLLGSRKIRTGHGVVVRKCMNASVTVIEVGLDRKGVLVQYDGVAHLGGVDVLESSADLHKHT